VYIEAVRQVAAHPSFQEISRESMDDEDLENLVGPYWVHIGDDFVKDVVAAKELRMRTVWATELVRDKLVIGTNEADGGALTEVKKVEEFVKAVSEMKDIEMSIGAESYLADSIQREFVDAIVEEFHHLSDVLLKWHEDGMKTNEVPVPTIESLNANDPMNSKLAPESKNNPLSVTMPAMKDAIGDSSSTNALSSDSPKATPRTFRLVREDCTMDIPAPRQNRENKQMKEIMEMAQTDKSSGVFSFPVEDVQALCEGNMVLMIGVVDPDLQFTRSIFLRMTVQEVLSLTERNPVTLSLYMKKSAASPGFDIF
jgi:hypothetical protein